MNLEAIATIVGLSISIGGTFAAVSQFYRQRLREMVDRNSNAVKKEYAAERDFNHLQRNYQQLQVSLDQLMKELDVRVEKLEIRFIRVETLMRVLTKELTNESVSSLLGKDED